MVEIPRREITFYDSEGMILYGFGKELQLDGDGYARHIGDGIFLVQSSEISQESGLVNIDGEWLWPMGPGRLYTFDDIGREWSEDEYGKKRFLSLIESTNGSRKTGIVDICGNLILPAIYDRSIPAGDKFSVIKGNYTGIVDADGNWLFRHSLLDYIPD